MNLSTYGKGLLVSGNTFPYRPQLKASGGTWNPSLKGWIFPKKSLADIEKNIPLESKNLDSSSTEVPEIRPSPSAPSTASSASDSKSFSPLPPLSLDEKTLEDQIASLEKTLNFLKSLRSRNVTSVTSSPKESSKINDSDVSDVEEERERDLVAQTGSLKLFRQTT